MRGRIIKGVGGLYTVSCGGESVMCRARGAFRRDGIVPTVGDYVEISGGAIDNILPRKNILIRPPIANLDIIFVCIPCARPAPDLLTADELTAIAEHNGIEPVIVITKIDEDGDTACRLDGIYRACGFDVFCVCSPEHGGTDELYSYIKKKMNGGTAAFSGASGVGKSSLMNTLFPYLELATGTVSDKTDRGRHTTRHVEIYDLSERGDIDGFLADTPGFSMLDFVRFDFFGAKDLPYAFREFEPYINSCRYNDCTHTKEEGCAVISAAERGLIPQSRRESYLRIYSDLKNKKTWGRS